MATPETLKERQERLHGKTQRIVMLWDILGAIAFVLAFTLITVVHCRITGGAL